MGGLSIYDLEYKGVKCTAVDWDKEEFHFIYNNQSYIFKQKEYIYSTADTDHIKEVISSQFILSIKK